MNPQQQTLDQLNRFLNWLAVLNDMALTIEPAAVSAAIGPEAAKVWESTGGSLSYYHCHWGNILRDEVRKAQLRLIRDDQGVMEATP